MTAPLIGPVEPRTLRYLLQFGDVLLYAPSGLFGRVVAVKTWSTFSHAELYVGEDPDRPGSETWGARDPEHWCPPRGGGVSYWPLRAAQLAVVRRPREAVDAEAVLDFCNATLGQRYDWWGLMRFFTVGTGKRDRMFCSEAVARALRAGGKTLFDNCDADEVSPGMLDVTRDLVDVWRLTAHAH